MQGEPGLFEKDRDLSQGSRHPFEEQLDLLHGKSGLSEEERDPPKA